MNFIFTEPFKKDYGELPTQIRRALDRSLKFFMDNARHPSLRAKKLPGTEIWYARVTRDYRFTFQYAGAFIILRRVGTHDILKRERKT